MQNIDQKRYYLGIDLHRDSITVHGTDTKGNEIIKGKYKTTQTEVDRVLDRFPRPPSVVVEATRNWVWLVTYLKKKRCHVTLAHPFKTKAIASARIKTDAIDAATLCHLLRADLVPAAYIASIEEIEWREIARARIQFVKDQTKIKNRIRAVLAKANLIYEKTDLFGVGGQSWLEQQVLTPASRLVVDLNMERLMQVQKSLKTIENTITEKGDNSPEVCNLKSIPAIGAITAFLLQAEIGDISRFPSADKLTAYLGIVPRISQSGEQAKLGRITKLGNPYVRWLLVQAAHRLVRKETWAKKFVGRLSVRAGKKKAIVALARKLAVIVYCVLKEQRPYYQLKA